MKGVREKGEMHRKVTMIAGRLFRFGVRDTEIMIMGVGNGSGRNQSSCTRLETVNSKASNRMHLCTQIPSFCERCLYRVSPWIFLPSNSLSSLQGGTLLQNKNSCNGRNEIE